MGGQAPGPLNCFLDKERPCDATCKAYGNHECQILKNTETGTSSLKKAARALEGLMKFLHHRPVPRP